MCLRAFCASVAAVVALVGVGCAADPEVAKQEYLKSADAFVAQQKYGEAIVQYRNALQQDPRFGEARLKLAETYVKLGDVRNGGREYIRAADLLPQNADVQLKAASYLLLSRQFEDAKVRAQKALELEPKNAAALTVLGNALAGLKDPEEAIEQLEEANKVEPTAVAFASMGAIQLGAGAIGPAEAAFRKAVEVEPKKAAAHLALANFLMISRRPADAEKSLKTAFELEPDNPVVNRGLAAYYLAMGQRANAEPHVKALAEQDTSPSATHKLALADLYAGTNRIDDARKLLEPLAAGKESFASASPRLAAIQYTQGQKPQAHKTIDDVLARDPKNVMALLTKARFLQSERKFQEALAKAQAATAAAPQSVQAHYLTGELLQTLRRPDQAMAAYSEVLKLNPRVVPAQVQLSRLNLAKGQTGVALQLAEGAAKAAPNDPNAQLALVRSLGAQGQRDRAVSLATALSQRYPNQAGPHVVLGALAASNNRPLARKHYERAYELQKNNIEALAGLSALDLAEKKGDAARQRIEAIVSAEPTNSAAQLLAARVYVSLNELDRAEQTLRSVIERDPSNLGAYGQLARLYLGQNKLGQAQAEFDRIAERAPSATGPRTVAAMIAEMQNNRPDARRRYEEIMTIDPRAAVAANNLAYLYAEEGGNLDTALQLAQTAKQVLPEAPEVSDTLGFVYLKKNLASLAIQPLLDSTTRDANNPIYHFHLGLAYAQSGAKTKARESLNRALALSQTFPGADQARQALRDL